MREAKIAIEEHINVPELVDDAGKYYPPDTWARLRPALLDIEGKLLSDMDACGIETSALSLSSPGIQAIPDKRRAVEVCRRANDFFAEQVAKRPDRFCAFAALPMQDPEAAAEELTRCVKDLHFKGALVNGFSQIDREDSIVYYDLPQYWPFWGVVESLNVPFYLHPRYPLEERSDMQGHPWLRGSVWAFGVETATHALRLMTCGLFDKYQKLTLILGHLGETLPNAVWRIDHRIAAIPRGIPAKRKLSDVLRQNVYATTSGNFCTQTLLNTLLVMGADRILFAVDYPFEDMHDAAGWFDRLDTISETDWAKIARTNAEKLLNLG
ncbi:MAG: amidohydrolase family protein [Thermodesulfobacteriota bacterium]